MESTTCGSKEQPWTQEWLHYVPTCSWLSYAEELVQLETAKQTIWWRYIDDVIAIWNHGQIYHRHFSNNQRVTPHYHVHSRMVHGPGDIPENHHGDPIQNKYVPKKLLTHVNVSVQIVATHSPAQLIHSIQRLSTWKNDFKTRVNS